MIDYTRMYSNSTASGGFDVGLRAYMLKIYNLMAVALFITGLSGVLTFSVEPLARLVFQFSPQGYVMGFTGLGWIINLSPIGIALYFFWGAGRIDVEKSQILFWVYAVLTGISLASLGFIYTGESLARTFFVTSAVFAAMSIYGYTTQRDLTSLGSFLIMGLIGVLIASVVNIFLASPAIYFVTSILGIGIFMGLIAWDTQKLKNIYYAAGSGEAGQRMAIVGAFSLYLDFINLFLNMLRFMGVRRNN